MAQATTIGLDVGGTKVAGVRLEGMTVAARAEQPTVKESAEALLEQMAAIADELGAAASDGVGAGVPSAVEWPGGRVIASVNVPFRDFPVRDLLAGRLGVPVAVDNDATVAALAEAHRDDGSIVANLVMLTLGTGVGGGIVCDGRVVRGATGAAGHLGHQIVIAARDGELADEGFPRPDSLEAIAAGPALDALAREAARSGEGELAEVLASGREPSGRDVVEAARRGDPRSIALLSLYARRVALGVANAIHSFDPDEVVVGGGVSAAGDLLLEPLLDAVRSLILPGVGTRTTVRLARHGSDAGAIGAALLARPGFRDQ